MSRVARIDDQLKGLPKPSALPVTDLRMGEGDYLVLCGGFEDRAVEALNRLVQSGSTDFNLIVVRYLPFQEANQFEKILALCMSANVRVTEFTYDRQNPAGGGEALLGECKEMSGRLFIDVSAMSRLLIVQLIVAFYSMTGSMRGLSILYCEAMEYPPHEDEVKTAVRQQEGDPLYLGLLISSGVFDLAVVPELSSVALAGQPIMIVAFPSFNIDQLAAVLGELQPYNTILIHGIPLRTENRWRTAAIRELNHTDALPQRKDVEASTLDYREVLDILLDEYSVHGAMERLVISATGSKMQTVAVGIFRAFMSDVQIVYPTSFRYPRPHEYTIGVQEVYQLDLDSFVLGAD